jgi:putative toxin-antitoxin system antitoxin component (TIGR02293 family)
MADGKGFGGKEASYMEDVRKITAVLGGDKVFGRKVLSSGALHAMVHEGLPYRAFVSLLKEINVSSADLALLLDSSPRTLARRKVEKKLSAAESDRVTRIARILVQASEVFEDEDKARNWLRKPNRELGGRTPLQNLGTDVGTKAVEQILGRLEFGVLG